MSNLNKTNWKEWILSMKNKGIILILVLTSILGSIYFSGKQQDTDGTIYPSGNQQSTDKTIYPSENQQSTDEEESYIEISIVFEPGITEEYRPTEYYEINKLGIVRYLKYNNKNEFEILGEIEKTKLKELEEKIKKAPIENNKLSTPLETRYYYTVVLNDSTYQITEQSGIEIVRFIIENIK